MRSITVSSRLLAAGMQGREPVLRHPDRVHHRLMALWRACLVGRSTAIVRLGRRVCGLGLFFLLWHLMTTYEVTLYVRFLNIPGPVEVLAEMGKLATSTLFYTHILTSLERIYLGFVLAACLGIP